MMPRRLFARLDALWNWRRKQDELDEEIQFHLSEEADERAADGLTADQAQAAATRDFGNPTLIREVTREAWGWASAERLLQDARSALRMMRRDPGFSAVAVLTLALGIGATLAILNVVSALLVRPLAFPDPDRIVVLFATTPKRGVYRDTTSFLDFTAWKTQSRAFTDAAAYRQDPFSITGDGVAEPVRGLRASHELLRVLGVSPTIGRGISEQEQHGGHAVSIISHGLWTRRYGNDPRILDRTILLNDVRHSIVGVLPEGFQFLPFHDTDVIVPIAERTCRSCGYLRGVARLRPGISISAAQQELDAIAVGLERAFPDSNEGRGVRVASLQDVAVGALRTPLLVLLGAGAFVLLIGCGNVGSLVLARAIARQRELAVRSALGAGTGRLVRQLLAESVSLALVAALLGAVLAFMGSELLVASLSQRYPLPAIAFDWALLAIGLLIAVFAGVLSGLPPALMVWKSEPSGALKQDGRSQSSGVTQHRLRNLLVVSQTALTVMLCIGAGLLLKSFVLLQRVEVGLNTRDVLAAHVLLPRQHAAPERREVFLRELLASVGGLPGVQGVAIHVDPPFQGGGRQETFRIDGHDDPRPGTGHAAAFNMVSGDFFRVMNIPVVRGRGFTPQDTAASEPVAVVNETMVRRFWPNQDAIGKRLRFYYDKNQERWLSIVGVVGDVRYRGRLVEPTAQVLVPGEQPFYKTPEPFVSVVVRTAGEPAALTKALRAAIWTVDKDVPILTVESMAASLGNEVTEPRIYTLLLSIFAAIALVIASAGIYGSSAYAVVRRTREIGIRMAVGAAPGQILTLVVRQGMALVLAGGGIGVAGSLALTKVVAGFLYGITPTDVPTFLAVLALFAAVAFLATYVPARRAARVDPALAFRYD
jgi:putative ABC transport system permease protein